MAARAARWPPETACGIGIAGGIADGMVGAVDGDGLFIGFGCSETQRKPHLGQNLDLCGKSSRQ